MEVSEPPDPSDEVVVKTPDFHWSRRDWSFQSFQSWQVPIDDLRRLRQREILCKSVIEDNIWVQVVSFNCLRKSQYAWVVNMTVDDRKVFPQMLLQHSQITGLWLPKACSSYKLHTCICNLIKNWLQQYSVNSYEFWCCHQKQKNPDPRSKCTQYNWSSKLSQHFGFTYPGKTFWT